MVIGGLVAGLALAAQTLWAGAYAYGAVVENVYEWRVFPVALVLGLAQWVAGIGFWLWDRRGDRDLPERIGRVEWGRIHRGYGAPDPNIHNRLGRDHPRIGASVLAMWDTN